MPEADEIARVCYEQNFEQARNLNIQMNQVPVLAMTLTGGLWFGAGVTEHLDLSLRFSLLMLAGFSDLVLLFATFRIRDVLESYFEKLKNFSGPHFATGEPTRPRVRWLGAYSMVSLYCVLMFLAAITSFLVAFVKYWPFAQINRCIGLFVLIGVLLISFLIARAAAHANRHGS